MRVAFIPVMLLALWTAAQTSRADFPTPSPYPVSWQLDFEWSTPERIVVEVPGQTNPQPFWYMTYRVTNNTDTEQTFLPHFELLTEDGNVHRSDRNIPLVVFEAIKKREKNPYLELPGKVAGTIRVGEDQAIDSVAIWPEPSPEMGRFSIFVSNLSGESVIMKKTDDGYKPVKSGEELVGVDQKDLLVLRKVLQLNFLIRGDEVFPGEDEVNENPSQWVMR
jgi:hypothetical protein